MANEAVISKQSGSNQSGKQPAGNQAGKAQAGSEGITADQLAHQLAQLRGNASEENDLDGAESADAEAEANGESEAALNAEASSVAATAPADAEAEGDESVDGNETETGDQEEQDAAQAEEESDLPAETQERINKRIGKEVAKRKTLEEENAQLKAQLAEAKNGKTTDSTDGNGLSPEAAAAAANATGFGGSRFEQQVQTELAQAESLMEWAQNNPGGGTVRGSDGKEYSFSAEQAGAIQRKAIKDVTRLTVKLENFQQEKGRNDQVLTQAAVAEYPKMFQKGSAENKLALKLLGDFPELLQLPGGKLALGDIVSATMGRVARSKTNGSQNGNGNGLPAKGAQPQNRPSPRPTRIPTGNGSAPGNRTGAASTRRTGVVDADANTVEGLAKSFAKRRAA